MSDADDQMGGQRPAPQKPPSGQEKRAKDSSNEDADEASKESFPASDPPGNY